MRHLISVVLSFHRFLSRYARTCVRHGVCLYRLLAASTSASTPAIIRVTYTLTPVKWWTTQVKWTSTILTWRPSLGFPQRHTGTALFVQVTYCTYHRSTGTMYALWALVFLSASGGLEESNELLLKPITYSLSARLQTTLLNLCTVSIPILKYVIYFQASITYDIILINEESG